jgi:enamine deaminase RidA (YjgF/YER057c/UK114 family)
MERRVVNPWRWQDQFGFVQANELKGYERVLICSGQTSTNEDGTTAHPADMAAQMNKCLDNLETVLREAGMTLENVVRLNYYTTDVDAWPASAQHWDIVWPRRVAVPRARSSA